MTSFTAIKRRIQPGTRLVCVRNTIRPDLDGTERTVRKVQTNAIAWTLDNSPDRGLQWTYWPPAREVTVIDDNTWRLHVRRGGADHHVELRFLTEGGD